MKYLMDLVEGLRGKYLKSLRDFLSSFNSGIVISRPGRQEVEKKKSSCW